MQCKPDDAHGRELNAAQAGAWCPGHEAAGSQAATCPGHRGIACESADSLAEEECANPGRRLAVVVTVANPTEGVNVK